MKSLILIVSTLLLVFGCTKDKKFDEREINLISPEKISGFDPINASDRYSGNEAGKVYEGLFEFHPLKRPYELMPNLAESMPTVSEDGLTYTIKLKKGVLFHDSPAFKDGIGREMKADDVIYSIKRLADPKLHAKGWWLLDDRLAGLNEWREKYAQAEKTNYDEAVEGLKKVDDYTVQMKLKRPFPQFLYALAMPYTFIVAKEAVEHFGKEFLNYPVGTGPFILPKFEQTSMITYVRNPKFREKFYPSEGAEGDDKLGLLADAGKKIPLVDKINVHIIVESQPKWLSFMTAKADLIEVKDVNIPQSLDDKKQLRAEHKERGVRLVMEPMLDVTYFAFNHEDPIFKNRKLRQAMNLAFDREGYNRLFLEGTGFAAQGPVPPGLGGQKKEFKNPFVNYDIEQAKKLLAEAGYPDGKGLPAIVVQTRSDTISRQQVEFFEKSMQKIGINIDVGMNTWPELVNKVTKKQHQMYTMAWGADYPDAENFLGLLYCPNQSPGSNGANYCNDEFDAIYKKATIMQDSPERTSQYEKLNEMVAHDAPWVFGFHRTEIFLAHAWLKNFKHMEFNHSQFQYLNVDLEVKKQLSKKF
ncbi:MAG: ABC transporter substrate-binding protein [Bacteriovoracia bacterium]